MKTRRLYGLNQLHSPKNSTTSVFLHGSDILSGKNNKKLFDIKRRRLQRGKLQKNNGEHGDVLSIKRDAFASLESLFDIKKPLYLSKLNLVQIQHYKEHIVFEKHNLKGGKHLAGDSIVKTTELYPKVFPNISKQKIDEENSFPYNTLEKSEEPNVNPIKLINHLNEKDSLNNTVAQENQINKKMADEELQEEEKNLEETLDDTEEETLKEMDDQFVPPPYPIPSGAGEGVPVKVGRRRESMLSSSPLTEESVMEELKIADERCNIVAGEIKKLKEEMIELTNKKELTDDDTVLIQKKQEDLMLKLAEFEQMTRKLQRLLGLTDPTSETFSRMFGLLPYPHTRSIEGAGEEIEILPAEKVDDIKGKKPPISPVTDDHFDLPQPEYQEDKLPRVIVCGYTEDEMPKIVIADGDRGGKKECLQNLTGKLTESLTMQEKLVKENAQLEGGKYKLEEALLEKDTAVECLQRKVCGLQAEIRLIMKENTELNRRLACLNQRVTTSTCCYTCPERRSSCSPPVVSPLPAYSQVTSSLQDHGCCQCKYCVPCDSPVQSPTSVCVNPYSNQTSNDCGSSRLAGGASRTGNCILSRSSSQIEEMCFRSPTVCTKPCPEPTPRGVCPAELENKFAIYGNNTKQLAQQLGSMECEVRNMQIELANVQRERQQLEQQRKLLKCSGPCAPCACCPAPPPCGGLSQGLQSSMISNYIPNTQLPPTIPPSGNGTISPIPMPKAQISQQSTSAMCTGPCIMAPMGASTCPQQQLRDLREQYARLQDDYKNKLCEVSCLRTDTEKLKQEVRDSRDEKERMEIKLIDTQERLKSLEAEREKFEGKKEQMVEQEQALLMAKERFRKAQDELEELRSLIQDQAAQLEDYRNKYLQAQQQVEEQRRQLDLMEMDNARMNENVTLEIGRVKNQFQEKLAELAPLPDILKQTQMKLQEAQQMRLVAERNCEDLSRELLGCKDKIQTLQSQLDVLRNEHQALQDERGHGTGRFDELEKKNAELRHDNERMKNTLARFEEHEAQLKKRMDEKMHEITQLTAMLEQVREDSARQVARTKERCETVRRTMQGQIAEMERQLAQCRATARAAQKDRDEIRQKMQSQINNLNEAFEQAQGRIRSLQGHVNYLKTSYSNIFKGQGESPVGLPGDGALGTGYDSCDCNY
ncbi:uncharacterized protein LOC124430761 [Vespa crabro]|uniref:uncharacterized protein LOC124430761 n=1 Tax=Vespa crabro TaxID=7445 RepID=UPI001F030E7C|nr:uncharacterized protein LOC124430761 [Vespa crabro]XP_046833717.1 uncharacterized protein LOC124430761 [Vespa crabro]